MAGVDKEPVEKALLTLANRSLVVADQEEKAFALMPMVADFLRRKRPETVAETGNRLEQRAYALIVEKGDAKHDRFPVLDAAWPSIAPALPLFLAGSNERLQTVCDTLDIFLEFTGRWDERLSLSQQAEAKAVASRDWSNAGWRAVRAAYVHYLRFQADSMLTALERATTHWETAKAGARERSIAVRLRGKAYQLKSDFSAAIAAFREALDLRRTLSVGSVDVAIAQGDLADAERMSGDFAAAETDYREALQIARAAGDREQVSICTSNLALLALNTENWSEAEALAREALNLSEMVGRQESIAFDCHVLARALVRQRKRDGSLAYAQRAVAIYTRLGSPRLSAAYQTLRECED